MTQRTLGRPSGKVWAGLAVAALMLTGTGFDAHAQTFNDAIQGALANNCSRLAGPYTGTLVSICGIPASGVGTSSGASIASQTVRQQGADERRIQLRLEEQRQARAGGGVLAASADPGFQIGKLGLFVSAEGDWVHKDLTRFEPGFSSQAGGVTVGADYGLFPWLTTGLAVSYLGTNGTFNGNNGHFNTDAIGVTLYGSATPMRNLFVDGTVGYTHRDYDVERRASFFAIGNSTGVNGMVQGDTTGDEFRTSVQTGYDFVVSALTVGPRVGVNYSTNDIASFSEHNSSPKGLDTGLQLAYEGQHRQSFTSTVGFLASYALSTGIGVFVPQINAEWVHEFLDNQRVIYFHFREDLGQAKFRFQTDAPTRNYGNVGGGVTLVLPKGLQAFLNFRALVGYEDRQSYTANGGIRIGF